MPEKPREIESANKEELGLIRKASAGMLDAYAYVSFKTDSGAPIIPSSFHRKMIRALEAVDRGEIKRLVIVMPPGHAKSTWASIVFPAWYLSRKPEKHVIHCANTALQSQLFSVAVRDALTSTINTALFPHIRPDKSKGWGEKEWFLNRPSAIDKDASWTSTGVHGPVLGRRADLIIGDDPMDEENSMTEEQRKKVLNWWLRTLMSRLKPDGAAVLVMTRWHEEDLAGEMAKRGWKTIHFPAISESGEALWPDLWPIESLNQIKEELGIILFTLMYQGDTSVLSGDIINHDWIKTYNEDERPSIDQMVIVGACDPAASSKETADKFCAAIAGLDSEGNLWFLEKAHDRYSFDKQIAAIKRLCTGYSIRLFGIEATAYQTVLAEVMWRELSGIPFVKLKPSKDKRTRLVHASSWLERGKVRIPYSWQEEIDQLTGFPNRKHDDFCDVFSYMVHLVEKYVGTPKNKSNVVQYSPFPAIRAMQKFEERRKKGLHKERKVLTGTFGVW